MTDFEAFFDAAPDLLCTLDRDGRITRANRAWGSLLGLDPRALVGRELADLCREDERTATEDAVRRALAGEAVGFEHRLRRADGSSRWVCWHVVLGPDGALVGIGRDDDERQRDLQDLRDIEERFQRLSEASLEGTAIVLDGIMVEVNEALCRITGYTADELRGEPPRKIVPPEDLDEVMRRITTMDEGAYDSKLMRKDGSRVHVEVRGKPTHIKGKLARVTAFRDVSELYRANARLAASERRWRTLLGQASDGIVAMSPQLQIVEANQAMCEMLGYTRDEVLRMSAPDIVDPADWAARPVPFRELAEGRTIVMERLFRRRDGSVVQTELSAKTLPDGNFQAIVRDISERKQAEERLRRSEARFRSLMEHLPDPLAVVREARLVYVNPACARFLGASNVDDLLGRSVFDFAPPGDREDAKRYLDDVLESMPTAVERRALRLDGEERLARLVTLPITYDGEPALMMIGHDITDQQRLETQLQQSQRMEAVGRLAGGIAHDFNNMLSVILNYAVLIRRRLPDATDLREHLSQIEDAAQRSATLTRQLLSFSRHQLVETEVLNPSDAVRSVTELLTGTLGEHIRLETRLDRDTWHVRMSRSQLEQVLVNLAVNARDAMPDGGLLRIEIENTELPNGRWVRLSVTDTGAGMAPDVIDHAFEPFFSTKPAGEGSGLGLAVVYGIIKRSGGTIVIESYPARETSFHIHLPAVDEEVTTGEVSKLTERPRGRGERVLVVEDETAVRELVCKLLERYGYVAIDAATPEDALDLARGGTAIDLLLSDVVMPGMNGMKLAAAVGELRPELPVVLMSGYADGVEGLEIAHPFLAKPFSPEELLAVVRTALDRAAETAAVLPSGA